MPSPFPGMDPYLEAPDIWPDFHDRLGYCLSEALNGLLPAPFYARLEMRPEIGIVEEPGYTRRMIPDVAVVRRPDLSGKTETVAVLDTPRKTISRSVEIQIPSDPIRHVFVEIRDPTRGHHLVTLIEIVSPSNKHRGPDRQSYLRKQGEVLSSDANLIEVDLLRAGDRLLPRLELERAVLQLTPSPHYLVLVNRAWQREEMGLAYQVFPILLTEALPCIPVPLRKELEEVPLDLQYIFDRSYNAGPYRRAIDYHQAPLPPLSDELVMWADRRLREAGLLPETPA